jgi:GNAT superfamily N-acetyltransferase
MAAVFRDLNLAWLERYFYVEDKDKEILDKCESSIIDQGGYIFFALLDNQAAGCFSLMRIDQKVYELGKMAVDPLYQGKKIGQTMMEFAIEFARKTKWKKILLYSHTSLQPAIHIYRKFGFKEVELEPQSPYHRSNIKMELDIEA